jgi:hypothetical protein
MPVTVSNWSHLLHQQLLAISHCRCGSPTPIEQVRVLEAGACSAELIDHCGSGNLKTEQCKTLAGTQ